MRFQFFVQDVPLSRIRHNDLPAYIAEGFGGSPVEEWPVYNFFRRYTSGEHEGAQRSFEQWYAQQLDKYHAVPKVAGGMHDGSLYRLIETHCKTPFALVSHGCKQEAISQRVQERFRLLESIKVNGYNIEKAERVEGVRKNGYVYLRGGHHRAAILRALGRQELPGVLVFPNQFTYTLFCIVRNIRHGNF